MSEQAGPDRTIGKYGGNDQSLRNTKNLVAMIRGRADREWHGHDAAEQCRPESVQERLVALHDQQHRVSRFQSFGLQLAKRLQRSSMEPAKTDPARRVEIIMKSDAVGASLQAGEQFSARVSGLHWYKDCNIAVAGNALDTT